MGVPGGSARIPQGEPMNDTKAGPLYGIVVIFAALSPARSEPVLVGETAPPLGLDAGPLAELAAPWAPEALSRPPGWPPGTFSRVS